MPGRIEVVTELSGQNPGKRFDVTFFGDDGTIAGEGLTIVRLNKLGNLDISDSVFLLVAEKLSMSPDELAILLANMSEGEELEWK